MRGTIAGLGDKGGKRREASDVLLVELAKQTGGAVLIPPGYLLNTLFDINIRLFERDLTAEIIPTDSVVAKLGGSELKLPCWTGFAKRLSFCLKQQFCVCEGLVFCSLCYLCKFECTFKKCIR